MSGVNYTERIGIARDGEVQVRICDRTYIYGGTDHTDELTIELIAYDHTTRKLIRCSDGPSTRFGHAMVAVDGKLYLHGGQTRINGDRYYNNDLHCYDPNTDTWVLLTKGLPDRSYHQMLVIGSRIYICGGLDVSEKDLYTDLWEYDTVDHTFYELTKSVIKHSVDSISIDGYKLLTYTGYDIDTRIHQSTYTPPVRTWTW